MYVGWNLKFKRFSTDGKSSTKLTVVACITYLIAAYIAMVKTEDWNAVSQVWLTLNVFDFYSAFT